MDSKFLEILKNNAVEGVEITLESNLFEDLGISSLGMFNVIYEIENEMGVRVNVMDLINVKTVEQLYQKIKG
ncbi:MAG: acyl carrier protein [Clostridia bacterium]|nr:acyl carrier protein [Clostridia bacterium]